MKTKMRTLITVKPHRYGTRHLTAGEEYELPARHALALVAAKKARYAPERAVGKKPAAAPEPTTVAAVERMESLRAEAERLGIEVDGRWGTIRLQHEIETAKGARR
jgi:hypothetical protein